MFPPGYIPYRNDRKTDAHGGLFILVSKKYLSSDPSELKSEETSEQLWIKLQIKGSPDLYLVAPLRHITLISSQIVVAQHLTPQFCMHSGEATNTKSLV